MKNEKIETPLINIERNLLLLGACIICCAGISYYAYTLFRSFSPWGFIAMIPGAILFFQSLWWIVNPFASIYENRVEIKYSMFNGKEFYFTDIKKIVENKQGKLVVVYTDDEAEPLNLFGIRASHVSRLKAEMEKQISVNALKSL